MQTHVHERLKFICDAFSGEAEGMHCCTGENWNTVMYDGMRATNAGAALYFLFIVIIGNYVVLNLFLAILLEQFSGGAKDEDSELQSHEVNKERTSVQWEHECSDPQEAKSADPPTRRFRPLHEPIRLEAGGNKQSFTAGSRIPSHMLSQQDTKPESVSNMLEGRSLFVFGPRNPLRMFLAVIIWHPRFEQLIIALIMMSSIVLAIDSPSVDKDGALKAALVWPLTFQNSTCTWNQKSGPCEVFELWWTECSHACVQKRIDFSFGIIFTVEATAKIIVYGWAFNRNAYIRSPWNVLDFLTVVVSILLLIVGDADGNFASLKSLRTLRALRPIRMASRWPGMKACGTLSCMHMA
jgi:voltage-dependent calcium channel L type alpha-1D